MTEDPKPPAVWIRHPPSGTLQQCSAAAWARRSQDPNCEDGLTGWVLAGPDHAALAEVEKAARKDLGE